MKPRIVEIIHDGSRLLARVPLGRSGQRFAELWADDWDFLCKLGTPVNWNSLGDAKHVTVCAASVPGNHLTVARILLNAGPGETVRYLDGNAFNLRRENLRLARGGWACKRDRDYLSEVFP